MAPLVYLEVLQPGKAAAAVQLAALERSLARVNPQVGHQLVLGIEWLRVAGAVPPVAGIVLGASPGRDVGAVDVSHQLNLVREFLSTVLPPALSPTTQLLKVLLLSNINVLLPVLVGGVEAVVAVLGVGEEFL